MFVAKRNIVDYIWKSAHLEGIGVTYFETQAIVNIGGTTWKPSFSMESQNNYITRKSINLIILVIKN